MKKVMMLVALALAYGSALAENAAVAQKPNAECAAPVFPARSVSNESVRRVEKQLKVWHACYQRATAGGANAEALSQKQAVDADFDKWLAATRGYSDGQGLSAGTLIRIERDRTEHMAADSRSGPGVARGAPR